MIAAVWLAAIVPASAEKADRTKPIHLEADRVTVDDAKQISIFTGNVVLTQGTMILRGDRMEVRQDKAGFRQGTTLGNLAYFRQKRDGVDEYVEGWAERIEYDSRTDKVQMFIRGMLKRGQDEVRGNYISYDAATEFFQVLGGAPQTAAGRPIEGRVRAIMQPKASEAAPTPGPKPDEGIDSKRDAGVRK
ncbi:MAG: lipopolysaccharide transport periplasmic protein LptA [Pseudomonadota bacterium]